MNCPKHPLQKMAALFTSYVCDVCDPPKQATINFKFKTELPHPEFGPEYPRCPICKDVSTAAGLSFNTAPGLARCLSAHRWGLIWKKGMRNAGSLNPGYTIDGEVGADERSWVDVAPPTKVP
jgi:hypothetical protein